MYAVLDPSVGMDQIIGAFFAAGKVADLTVRDAELDAIMQRIYTA